MPWEIVADVLADVLVGVASPGPPVGTRRPFSDKEREKVRRLLEGAEHKDLGFLNEARLRQILTEHGIDVSDLNHDDLVLAARSALTASRSAAANGA